MGIYEKSYIRVSWRLFEFVSPMGRGAIVDWRSGLSTVSRVADLDTFLRNIAKKAEWVYPDVVGLSGRNLKGLYELRWRSENVPHRIGGYFAADDQFVMLIGWTHNKRKYDPPSALETIIKRRSMLRTGEAGTREYRIIAGR